MNGKRSLAAWLALALFLVPLFGQPTYPSKPLDRMQVLTLMDFGDECFRVVQLIHRSGISFTPTADGSKLFKDLGATPALIQTLEQAKPVVAPHGPNPEEQSAFAHLVSCMTLARKGDVAEAQKQCHAATSYEPGTTYFALGNVLLKAGRTREAVKAFKAAEKANPQSPDTRNYLGLALDNLGKWRKAEKEYESAIRLDPDFDTPHSNISGYYLHRNDLDGAKKELIIEALQMNPNSASAHNNLAVVYTRQGNHAAAISELRKAADLEPNAAFRHKQLAEALRQAKDDDGAIAEYRRALELAPDWVEGHMKLAMLLLEQKRPGQAVAECSAANRYAPGNAAVRKFCDQLDQASAELAKQATPTPTPGNTPSAKKLVPWKLGNMPLTSRGATGEAKKQLQAMKQADFTALYDKARSGDAHSEAMVCIAYRLGRFVKHDDRMAFDWCLKAAEQNDLVGEEDVGAQYMDGFGAQQSSSLAIEWLKKAAEQGSTLAMGNLGAIYANGLGVPQDYAAALKWYRAAADAGDPRSKTDVGIMYLMGQGVAQDPKDAVRWFLKSAVGDYAYADFILSMLYARGYGVERDAVASHHWLRKAAALGEPHAETELGWMYANGVGFRRDYSQAVTWYRRAAEQGDPKGAYGLGVRYLEGQGVARNFEEAVKWFRVAADHGHGDAAYNLGLIYGGSIRGTGIRPNAALAAKYFRIAAGQGIGDGQCKLAGLYFQGKGVPKNDVAAYEWALLATEHGTEQCGSHLKALSDQMTAAQIQQAKSQAAAWKPIPHPIFSY